MILSALNPLNLEIEERCPAPRCGLWINKKKRPVTRDDHPCICQRVF